MDIARIGALSGSIRSIKHFTEFAPHIMKIIYGLSEISTSDDKMMNEIKEVFKRKQEELELELKKCLED